VVAKVWLYVDPRQETRPTTAERVAFDATDGHRCRRSVRKSPTVPDPSNNQAAIRYRSAETWSAWSAIEDGTVRIHPTDGVLTFDTDEVVAVWHHTHSLTDFVKD
jgi:hypothetical protein